MHLSAKDLDGDDAEDEGAWGEGGGWWSGVGIEHTEDVKGGVRALEGPSAGENLRPGELSVNP